MYNNVISILLVYLYVSTILYITPSKITDPIQQTTNNNILLLVQSFYICHHTGNDNIYNYQY